MRTFVVKSLAIPAALSGAFFAAQFAIGQSPPAGTKPPAPVEGAPPVRSGLPSVKDGSDSFLPFGERKPLLPGEAPPTPPNGTVKPAAPATTTPPVALPEIIDARKAFEAGDPLKCLELLRIEFAKTPHLPPPKVMLAGYYMAADRLGDARALLEDSARDDPQQPQLHLALGQLGLAEGRLSDAELHFEKALGVPLPGDWPAAFSRKFKGLCLGGQLTVADRRQHLDLSQEILSRLVDLEPQNADLRDRWATALFQAGRQGKAFEQFDIAYRQSATMNPPEVSMGTVNVQLGKFAEANRWYDAALRKYPSNIQVHFEYSVALMMQDREAQADQEAAAAEKLGLTVHPFLLHRAQIALSLKDHVRAEEYLQKAMELAPADPAARDLLAVVLIDSGVKARWPKALELAEANARLNPTSPQFMATLGWVLLHLDRPEEAKKQVQAALSRKLDLTTMYFAAGVYQRAGQTKEVEALAYQIEQALVQPSVFPLRGDVRTWLQKVRSSAEKSAPPSRPASEGKPATDNKPPSKLLPKSETDSGRPLPASK